MPPLSKYKKRLLENKKGTGKRKRDENVHFESGNHENDENSTANSKKRRTGSPLATIAANVTSFFSNLRHSKSPPPPACELSSTSAVDTEAPMQIDQCPTAAGNMDTDYNMDYQPAHTDQPNCSDEAPTNSLHDEVASELLRAKLRKSKEEYEFAAVVAREATSHSTEAVNRAESAKREADLTLISAHRQRAVETALTAQRAIEVTAYAVKERLRTELIFKEAQNAYEQFCTSINTPTVLYDDVEDGAIVDDGALFEDSFEMDTDNNDMNEAQIPVGSCANRSVPPSRVDALAALECLNSIIKPRRNTGYGHRDNGLDTLTTERLTHMQTLLYFYTSERGEPRTWRKASMDAAESCGRGTQYYSKILRRWVWDFIEDRDHIPVNNFGKWKESLLDHEDLAQEIRLHLQSIGEHVRAQDIVDYLDNPDVKARLKLKKTIALSTAQSWMVSLGYRWTSVKNGQYIDGHERPDVVRYRQEVFLPLWAKLVKLTQKWSNDNEPIPVQWPNDIDDGPRPFEKMYVLWYHDESTFFAHDRRKTRWISSSEKTVPQQKGEGISLMAADFVSADYGWSRSRDGERSARVYFRAGRTRDGYFDNDAIVTQAHTMMDLLEEEYPNQTHVLVYDNATTHQKRHPEALSARHMPKGPSTKTNWGIMCTDFDENHKPRFNEDGTKKKKWMRMRNGVLPDGTPQSFYFPNGHPKAGIFKGMAIILEERGYTGCIGKKGRRAECTDFSEGCIKKNRADCCCRRILFNEPDFVNVKSRLEEECEARGFIVLFLPKFHCELNFIEQCWGYAKRVYRRFPASSKAQDLRENVEKALDSVPLHTMRRFADRANKFADAYMAGLDGKQAAWATKKYRGHRSLPSDWKKDLIDNNVTRYDGTVGFEL